ncbi:hypothetical protein R3W88_008435 [Solanum pinnatisectum]|uniref:Uncharacterized protein n=1 Tax=Solanum pinnatisectum TaxID=50273 RepID=A0AAV9MAP8_9SOLN|nr:hypothetical protein R3W88_008435 [Solanum pinnatisectum]
MNIEDEVTVEVRSTVVDIRYDYVSKSFGPNPQKQQEVVVHHYERKDSIPIHHQKTILENAVDITTKASNNQMVTEEMTMDSDENKTEYLEIEDTKEYSNNCPHVQQSQEYNHLAIVEVPVVIQVDAIQVFKVESPNKVLHDIVTHNIRYSRVQHLPRTGSDHAPMLLNCEIYVVRHRKPFRILKFWTESDTFTEY